MAHAPKASKRLRIRPLRPADIAACAAIVGLDPLWHRYGTSVSAAGQRLRSALRRREGLYVAAVDGAIVGFVWFLLGGTFAHSGYVRWLGVAASARRRGVGTALMDAAERRIFRHGPNVFLLVSAFNRSAQHFYRRRDYHPVGVVSNYVARGLTERLYRKTTGPIRP